MRSRFRTATRLIWQTARDNRDVRGAGREALYGLLECVPGAFPRYERWRHPTRIPSDGSVSLVVEGYMGSANTWTSQTLQLANPCAKIARHIHRPGQVLEAVRFGLPTIVLVRDPVDAITSILARQPQHVPTVEVARYEYFYATCWPVADRVVVATFQQAVEDVDGIVSRLNARYGTHFAGLSDLGMDGREIVMKSIAESDRRGYGVEAATIRGAYPTEARTESAATARRILQDPRCTEGLSRCMEWFNRYSALAARQLPAGYSPPPASTA